MTMNNPEPSDCAQGHEPEAAARDRELLELAALAAGYADGKYQDMSGWGDVRYGYEQAIYSDKLFDEVGSGYWNPLANDGDALRLANKLWFEVRHVHGKAHVGMPHRFWCTEPWFPDGDQDAATRRAIVRAAAAIGSELRKTASGCSHTAEPNEQDQSGSSHG